MSDEERPRASEPNQTQQRIDEEGTEGAPVDASWEADEWGSTRTSGDATAGGAATEQMPHEGEEGQAGDVA